MEKIDLDSDDSGEWVHIHDVALAVVERLHEARRGGHGSVPNDEADGAQRQRDDAQPCGQCLPFDEGSGQQQHAPHGEEAGQQVAHGSGAPVGQGLGTFALLRGGQQRARLDARDLLGSSLGQPDQGLPQRKRGFTIWFVLQIADGCLPTVAGGRDLRQAQAAGLKVCDD